MSVTRACLPCRTAKAKCDLTRPACGRCTQRQLSCSGFPVDDGFVFRNENEVAQRNSRHARRTSKNSPTVTVSDSFEIIRQSQVAGDSAGLFPENQNLWLNRAAFIEVPRPLKRDYDTRAVERFFVNWTLNPSTQGVSLGHMHDLPMLYFSEPSDSALSLAVRAVAFADLKHESPGNPSFYIKARQQYGAALKRVRMMIHDKQELGNDHVLTAMLLIDNFELMYLSRNDPLGPHVNAIKYIMQCRTDEQLYHPTRFSLWRLGHYRLQSWQTLLREHPDPEQIEWIYKLNTKRPDLRICVDVLHMNVLSALAKTLIEPVDDTESTRVEKLKRAEELSKEMYDLIISMEKWTSEITEAWRPKDADAQDMVRPQEVGELPSFPIPSFPYPQLLNYEDVSLAYIWNFYAASQIVLRESLVEVLNYTIALRGRIHSEEGSLLAIQMQQQWVHTLSEAIIRTFPMLLGFMKKEVQTSQPPDIQQGKMAGRLFCIFAMWVIQMARFTSHQQKKTAAEVLNWIKSRHGLD